MFIPRLSQVEQSTWCAGTRTRRRRRGLISSRKREIKYSMTHFSNTGQTLVQTQHLSLFEMSLQEVYVHILDLSETKKVWEFAEAFKRKYKTLNVLVRHKLFGNTCQCVIRLLSQFFSWSLCQCYIFTTAHIFKIHFGSI